MNQSTNIVAPIYKKSNWNLSGACYIQSNSTFNYTITTMTELILYTISKNKNLPKMDTVLCVSGYSSSSIHFCTCLLAILFTEKHFAYNSAFQLLLDALKSNPTNKNIAQLCERFFKMHAFRD